MTIDSLLLVTLALTLTSGSSHASPEHSQRPIFKNLLGDQQDTRLPATVSQRLTKRLSFSTVRE